MNWPLPPRLRPRPSPDSTSKDEPLPATEGTRRNAALHAAAERWPMARRAFAAIKMRWPRLHPAIRSPVDTGDELAPEVMLQQLTRVRTNDGREAISGTLAAEFAIGQRDATLYIAFCPPFERLPDVDAWIADDSGATVKLAQRLHQGAQFEVRLSEPADEPFRVTVEFVATAAVAAEPQRPLLED
jgi:hypothetical protein